MTYSRIIGATAIAASLLAVQAMAASHGQTPQQAAVKARQATMTLYSFNIGVLGAMAQGKADYDADAAMAAAGNLAKLTSTNQATIWIPGTSNADMQGTRALPAIWQEGSDVGAKAGAVAEAAAAMADAAGNGLDALQAAMGPLGQACGACHRSYRARN